MSFSTDRLCRFANHHESPQNILQMNSSKQTTIVFLPLTPIKISLHLPTTSQWVSCYIFSNSWIIGYLRLMDQRVRYQLLLWAFRVEMHDPPAVMDMEWDGYKMIMTIFGRNIYPQISKLHAEVNCIGRAKHFRILWRSPKTGTNLGFLRATQARLLAYQVPFYPACQSPRYSKSLKLIGVS